jgi:hypothetical protein
MRAYASVGSHAARGAPPRQRLRAGFAAAVVAICATAACEGDNLFSGGTGGTLGPPVVTSVIAPAMINAGDPLDLRVRAVAPGGLTRIDIRYRRAVVRDTAFSFQSRRDTVTLDASLQLPVQVPDSIVVVEIFATDASGHVSDVLSRTIRVLPLPAGPVASAALLPGRASAGNARPGLVVAAAAMAFGAAHATTVRVSRPDARATAGQPLSRTVGPNASG